VPVTKNFQCRGEFDKGLLICPRYSDVEVIVPGDDAFVANSTKQGPTGHPVRQLVYGEKLVYISHEAVHESSHYLVCDRQCPLADSSNWCASVVFSHLCWCRRSGLP
jgi:hypothetical protein